MDGLNEKEKQYREELTQLITTTQTRLDSVEASIKKHDEILTNN